MRIDFLSTEPHFIDHMRPIWDALPEDAKGNWFQHAAPQTPTGNITLTCAWGNLKRLNGAPSVYMEHGIGMSYVNAAGERFHPSYAGSSKRDGVILFLNNHELTHDLNRKAHPNVPGVIVGTPKLDPWSYRRWETPADPIAVYSTHWDGHHVVPEIRSAHKEFRWALRPSECSERFTWNGHAHPRAWNIVKRDYRDFAIPTVKQFFDVLDLASVYVADTTSTLYEFAYTGKPVVCMNASFYRKDVNHGIRFWDYVPGIQVDHWKDLTRAVERSLDGEGEDLRARAVDVAYPIRDGTSSQRAADALCDLL
jgi:hypothetical protein